MLKKLVACFPYDMAVAAMMKRVMAPVVIITSLKVKATVCCMSGGKWLLRLMVNMGW